VAEDVAAAIDIGSNTVHMLVGAWRNGRVVPLDDAAELIGLAEDVYTSGRISPARLAEAVDALERLVHRVREGGANSILLVATAAVRDAANADDLAAAVRERTGIQMQLIDGEREARLTYRGASAGEESSSLQVCDVGGGSTEVIRAEGGRVILQLSLPLGSSRLARLTPSDPPTADEVAAAFAEAERVLAALPAWRPERLVVTGGTATALARVMGSTARRYDITRTELDGVRALLARHPAGEIAATYGITPGRARLLPAGAAIIAALLQASGVPSVVLSAAGLRDGLLSEHFEGRP
jgi:exopolyphosphatase / guanosine-5'-triphosphate,3'-diphosphate pyrophosphatase